MYFDAECALGNLADSLLSPFIGGKGGRLCSIVFCTKLAISVNNKMEKSRV